MVDVVGEAHGDAPVPRTLEGAADDLRRRIVQAEVVERDVEAVVGLVDEIGNRLRDLGRGLPAVLQRPDVDQER